MKRFVLLLILSLCLLTLVGCNSFIYTISFDCDGGSEFHKITTYGGVIIKQPEDPTKEGFIFGGWYLNEEEYVFNEMPYKNITLKAKWNSVIPTITFDSDGGSPVASITKAPGATVTAPEEPTKEGYVFDGWYLNEEKYSFNTMPYENINLIAHWVSESDIILDGLVFTLNDDRNSYSVTDQNGSSQYIDIPSYCNGLPVTAIGNSAFANDVIVQVNIPETVTVIGENAFVFTMRLERVTIPASVRIIDFGAFHQSFNLKEVTIEENSKLEMIGKSAFGLTKIVSFQVPQSVTKISEQAFQKCANLTTVIFEENSMLETIGYEAFVECPKLASINLPSQLAIIQYDAFKNCTMLSNIVFPMSITNVENDAFLNTGWFNKQSDGIVYINKVLYKYKGVMGPNASLVVNDGIVSISKYAFRDCQNLISITLPDGLLTIHDSAFYNCPNLLELNIPESVTEIGWYALSNTAWERNLPAGGVYINKMLYKYIGTVPTNTPMEVLEGTTKICSGAFSNKPGLTSITIPDSVEKIGIGAFASCNNLKNVIFGENSNLKEIDSSAFTNCNALITIEIPDSVNKIGLFGFRGCGSLANFKLPADLTFLDQGMFYDCRNLQEVTINDKLTSLDLNVFKGCFSLRNIIVSENNTSFKAVDGSLYSIDGKTLVQYAKGRPEETFTIPEGVKTVHYSGLIESRNLRYLYLPSTLEGMDDLTGCFNLETIGVAANNELFSSIDGNLYFKDKTMLLFVNRNVTSYTIPDTVTFIHAYAFDGCVNMTKIVIPKTVTYINAWAFKNCPGLTIYCEAGSDQVHWNPAWNYDNLPVVWNYVGQ